MGMDSDATAVTSRMKTSCLLEAKTWLHLYINDNDAVAWCCRSSNNVRMCLPKALNSSTRGIGELIIDRTPQICVM